MVRDATLRRLTPFVAAALFFAGMAALYALDLRAPYMAVIRRWGINPWPFPFLDTDTILSAVRCRQAGIDVYAANPCDVLGRVYDYSPLWLASAWVPGLGRHIVALGLAVDLGFLLSLTLLPPVRHWRDAWIVVAGALSSASLYATERGNNDLVIFALAALAATLSCKSRRARLIGYGAALLGGLLKYYPMTLMALATREAPRWLALVACASIAAVALFVAVDGHDLARALALIPTGPYISDMFGSSTLAGGLSQVFGVPDGALRPLMHGAMVLCALALMARIGARPGIGEDVAALTPRERAFLMAGAMLTLGCFFTAQNIGYRAVHLVLVLPALTALQQISGGRRRHGDTVVAVLGLLWAEGWRAAIRGGTAGLPIGTGAAFRFSAWLLRESLWWWTIVALGSLVVAALLRSESGVAALKTLHAVAPWLRASKARGSRA